MSGKKEEYQGLAHGLDINPHIMESMHSITPYKMPWYFYSFPQFVEQQDLADYKRSCKTFAKYAIGASAIGLILNTQIKRISTKFLSLPYSLKIPIRFTFFVLPFGFIGHILVQQFSKLSTLNDKYYVKVIKFRTTGDINHLGSLAMLQQFRKTLEKKS